MTDSHADKVSVDRYPALDPAANTGILADHFYLLDSPQGVGRGHVFYAVEEPKNGAVDATRSKEIEGDSGAKARSHLPVAKPLTKNQILAAFADLVPIKLASAMEDGLVWTSDARKAKGTAGGRHSSLWDPVIMAIALRERYHVPMTKLNAAFNMHRFLDEWRDEWKDKSRPD